MEEYKKYSDAILIIMAEGTDDEEYPFALLELAFRKNPKTEEICLYHINRMMKFEKNFKSLGDTNSALDTLYVYDKLKAITFFKNHYKELPIDALGGFMQEYTFVYYNEGEEIDKDLVKLIKDYLKTLTKKDIAVIQEEYDEFMKAYKNI